jgi:phosphoserine aminotransferase
LGHRPIRNIAYDVFGRRWANEIKKNLKNNEKIVKNKAFFNSLEDKEYIKGEKKFYEVEDSFCSDLVFVYTGTSTGRRWQDLNYLKKQSESEGLTICDATSALFAETMPWQYLDITCGSFQKALGAEAGLALVILSPKAVSHLNRFGHAFIPPRIIRLSETTIDEITSGKLINTISMLNLHEIAHNLYWLKDNGGLSFSQKRCIKNQQEIISMIPEGLQLTLPDHAERALTVLCIRPTDPELQNWEYIHKVADKATELGVYEIAGHPEEFPCWRFWTGPTITQAGKGFSKFLEALSRV